ncbi:MAG TPA: hypothetical protein VGM52_18820 [Herbaspirillum sp.]|jgi:hypothetical protein
MMNIMSLKKNRIASAALTTVPFIVVTLAWFYFAVLNPVPFWQQTGDYSWYALSHAFTLESDLSGVRAINFGYNIHPGVPFGIASWLAFRLATLGISESSNRISYAIAHAENFWMWAKIIALTLNLTGLYVIQRMFSKDLFRFLIASGLYFAAVPTVFGTSLAQLTNESFALPFVAIFYFLTFKLLTAAGEREWDPANLKFTAETRNLCCSLGALTAIGCSIKIYYMAPAFGLVIAIFVAIGIAAIPKKAAFKMFIYGLAGFLFAGTIVVFILGKSTALTWIGWNWGMLSHSDRYGTGSHSFMQWASVKAALEKLIASTKDLFPLIIGSSMILAVATTILRIRDNAWKRANLPFAIALFTGITINFLGLIKHYAPHYALPICASLPCLLLIVKRNDSNQSHLRLGEIAVLIAVVIMFTINIRNYALEHAHQILNASATVRDEELIEKLPLAPGEKRVWGYFSPTKGGVTPMITNYAGSEYVTQILKTTNASDISPGDEKDTKNWRYVIFPKSYFPTAASIPENYPKMFDFATTNFTMHKDDQTRELETMFVLTRTPKPAPDLLYHDKSK